MQQTIAAPQSSTTSSSTQIVFLSVVGALVLGFYARKSLKQIRDQLLFRRLKKDVHRRFGPGVVASADHDAAVDEDAEGDDAEANRPTLSMVLPGGASHEVELDLSMVDTMRQLQALVLDEWVQAGGNRRENLMMEHVNRRGRATKVSKITTLAILKAAPVLNLMPKRAPASSEPKKYGRLRQSEPGDSRTAPHPPAMLDEME